MTMTTAREIIEYMESLQDEKQRQNLIRFFKTAPGEYGFGDEFLGIKVPQTRDVVKAVKDTPLSEIPELLMSCWHEVRLCGLLILVNGFERLSTKRLTNDLEAIRKRDEIVTLYLEYAERANNWDLVDLSVHKIIGHWLLLPTNLGGERLGQNRDYKLQVLDSLAHSPCLWKQRMSIVCSWKTSQQGDPSWCLRYAEVHLHHPHDLMHKAVGWMLREMGSRVSIDLLRDFLRQHAHEMPRTMLRYAIEKMSNEERQMWMSYRGNTNPYAAIPIPDFVDIILHDSKQCDEAAYYLLHHRIDKQLREVFNVYSNQLLDDYGDIVEDFYLYLREGKEGKNSMPFQSFRNIRNKESFEGWTIKTFRNYLSNRAKEERRISLASVPVGDLPPDQLPPSLITDERKLYVASELIAYALQVFYPRGRFIFLRSILTMLNKQRALPNEEIAEALGMSYLSYRVIVHRLKCNLTIFRIRLLNGEKLRLDSEHQQMANRIYEDFTNLYPQLITYYSQCIESLKCRDAIKALRQQYYEATGNMLHEPSPTDTPVCITVTAFWNKLNRLLLI